MINFISTFVNTEMEARNRCKIRVNTVYLCENVDIDGVLPRLFQEKVITLDDKERIEWERTTKDKISKLLSILSEVPNSYGVFLKTVDPFIKEKLDGTVIPEEDLRIGMSYFIQFVSL